MATITLSRIIRSCSLKAQNLRWRHETCVSITHVAFELVITSETLAFRIVRTSNNGTKILERLNAMLTRSMALKVDKFGNIGLTTRFWADILAIDLEMLLLMK